MIRAFVAIELTEEAIEYCSRISQSLKQLGLKGSFPAPQSLHLTLKFLGNIEERIISSLEAALTESSDGVEPFSIQIGGVGVFPSHKRPRVLWVGVTPEPALIWLHRNLEKDLAALGFAPERRAFRPHLTLMRLRSLHQLKALVAFLEHAARDPRRVRSRVPAFHLYRSVLRPQGAEYTKLFSVDL